MTGHVEGREGELVAQAQAGVGDHGVRHVVALRELELILERLRRETGDARAERRELLRMIAKGTRLRRAAPRAGNRVPAGERRLAGLPAPRVDVENLERGDVDRAVRRLEDQRRQHQPGQVIGSAVVLRHRQAGRQGVQIVFLHTRRIAR